MSQLNQLATDLNAFELRFDPALLKPIQQAYQQQISLFFEKPENQKFLKGGHLWRQAIKTSASKGDYYLFSYQDYPLLWVSCNSAASLMLYQNFFEALPLAQSIQPYVDFEKQIQLYAGFWVIGNQAPHYFWHHDYQPQANAYTLITPLFDLAPEHGHLAYEDAQGQRQHYLYQIGKALIFGEGFLHSTEPYAPTQTLRVLLSLTFGTDKWQHWPILKQTIQAQSHYYLQPCGHPVKSCLCQLRFLLKR